MIEHLLIVNADDYGLTAGVSAGIRRAHLNGLVTSTTAMMNLPETSRELEKALHLCPNLGLGVHLTLTCGAPLLPGRQVKSLVDQSGCFKKRAFLLTSLSSLVIDEVTAEWRAQIEQFIHVTGKKPDHLDSHHHSSYFSLALFTEMLKLAAEFECPVRMPYSLQQNTDGELLSGCKTDVTREAVESLLKTNPVTSPQSFCGDFYAETAAISTVLQIMDRISTSTCSTWELMCHPGICDEQLNKISSYNQNRNLELAALTDPKGIVYLQTRGISLIAFSALH
jgi:chitin disaccharide deacetylase